jgi:uncharacterized repeat protein (TIGR01451 family)
MKPSKKLIHILAVTVLLVSMLFGGAHLLSVTAATELGPGDAAIIGFSFSDNDFAFVLLVDIDEGTEIRFTDAGWTADQEFFEGEGAVTYTAPTDLETGTVISYGAYPDDFTVTVEGPFTREDGLAFTMTGDQLFAFQGSYESPTFLYGLNNQEDGWTPTHQNAQTTYLPDQLIDGYTAISFDRSEKNGVYTGPLEGTPEELLAAISDPANWNYTSEDLEMPSTPFEVDPGPPNVDATTPENGAVNVLRNSAITIEFNKDVIVTGEWYTIECSVSGVKTATVSGGPQDYILQPDEPFVLGDICTVTVVAEFVTDTEDPPVNMEADYVWSFSVIEEAVVLDVGFESNSPVVLGESATFANTTTGEPPITFEWDFGDGGTSTEVEPVHDYTAVGTYQVTLTATNNDGSASVTHDFVVDPEPLVVSFTSNSPVYLGQTSVFTNTTTGNEPITYYWDFGDDRGTSTEVNPEYVYRDPGDYTVTLTATNAYETGTYSAIHTVHAPLISLDKIVYPEENVPLGGSVTYTITLENYGQGAASGVELTDTLPEGVSFGEQISGPDLTVDGNDLSWMGTIEGQSSETFIFTAVVNEDEELYGDLIINWAYVTTTNSGLDDDPASFRVAYEPLTASFTSNTPVILGDTSVFTNTTTGKEPISYAWDFGDESEIVVVANPVHIYEEAGIYEVTLTATSGTETSVATETHVVLSPPELAIQKSVAPYLDIPLGGGVTFTITLTNSGQAPAEGVALEDMLPDGLVIGELVGESPGEIDEVNNSVSWDGSVPFGDEVVIVFTAYVEDDLDLFGVEIENVTIFTSTNAGEGQASASVFVRNMPTIYFPSILVERE